MYQILPRFVVLTLVLALTLAACTLQSPVRTPPAPTPTTATLAAATVEPTPTQEPTAAPTPTTTAAAGATLRAHFIDVRQGDATLLEGEGFAILIDTGRHVGNEVVPYLQSAGITGLDLLIITHPHADHIGQVPQVMAAFPVGEVWMSGNPHTTLTFERAIDAVEASNAGYHEPRAVETLTIGPVLIEVVNPTEVNGDLHDGSVSVRVTYGAVRFVFTGDAEAHTEQAMVQRGHDLEAQVLQVGHHGSRTSSSAVFLAAVRPEVAIYSAGAGNIYGHPHQEALDRLLDPGIRVYGTDIHGTIVVSTDGATYQVLTQREGELPTAVSRTPTPLPPECRADQVNVNTAPAGELVAIIHIGIVRAEEMVDLRPFSSVDDLTRVRGIGPSLVADIKEQDLACAGR